MKLTLDPQQVRAVEFGLEHRAAILGLKMGHGKSAVALSIWERVHRPFCVVVCPAYLVLNWKVEIEKCIGPDVRVSCVKKAKDLEQSFLRAHLVIMSYGHAQKAEVLFGRKPFLIVDEAHALGSMDAKRTEYMHRVVYENSLEYTFFLTGTPAKGRIRELYSLIALCYYHPRHKECAFLDTFPDSVTFADHFSNRQEYTLEIGNRWVTVVKWEGIKNKDELKAWLKDVLVRSDPKPLEGLEPYRVKDVLISEKADPKLLAEFNAHFKQENMSGVNSTAKAEAALKKVAFTVQYVKGLIDENVGPVAIYTDHVSSAEALANAFDTKPITGAMPVSERMRLAGLFQSGKLPVIVATMKAFSTGVSLTRSQNLVLNDYSWTPADIDQTVHRIYRKGQTGRCVIHRMLGSPQDQEILKALEEKSKTIGEVT